MILIGLKLLSNEVIAKICCRLKFSATMASRFVEADEEELRNTSENKNTKRSTDRGLTFSNNGQRREEKMSNSKTTKYQSSTRRSPNIFTELRKENGEDYEPDSLKVLQAALDRHLRSKTYPKSIVRDTEFLSSRKVLEGKARKLHDR